MGRGSVYRILHDENVKLTWEVRRKFALDAARGMNYLHSSDPILIHRDLKSHNLLVRPGLQHRFVSIAGCLCVDGTFEPGRRELEGQGVRFWPVANRRANTLGHDDRMRGNPTLLISVRTWYVV